MALSRKAKIWLIILSIPVVLIAGGLVAAKLYFTNDRLKAFIIPQLEEGTGRKVAIADISLSVFPSFAVEIDSLSIANTEGFSPEPFISLGKLVLDVRIASLLKGSFEVTTVVLDRPQVLLEIDERGVANYAAAHAGEQGGTGAGANGGKTSVSVKSDGGALLISNFQIVNGSFAYIDRKGNSATRVEGLNLKLRAESIPVTNEGRAEIRATIEKLSYGSVSTPLVSDLRIACNQSMRYKDDILTIEKGEGTVQDIALTLSGSVRNVLTGPVVDIVIESAKANIADLLSLAPKEYMKKAEGMTGDGVASIRISLTGTINDTTNPDITGVISSTNASIHYAQLPKPITDVNIVMDFARTRTKKEFRVTRFSASLGTNPLGGSMTVENFDDPFLTLAANASLNLAEVKDFYPLERGTTLAGVMKANVNIAGKVSKPEAMKASGSMDFRDVTINTSGSSNPVRNLNGGITFSNQVLEAKKLSMTLGRSDLSLAFRMKNYLSLMSENAKGAPPSANLTLTSNHLYTADIMSQGETPQKGAAAPQPGGAPTLPKQSKAAAPAAKRPAVPFPNMAMDVTATIGALTMEKFDLTNVRGTMKIAGGVMTIQNLSCNTFDGSIVTKGRLDFQKPDRPSFDLALDATGVNANTLLSAFSSFGKRLSGKLTMNTTLRGELDDTLGLVPGALNGQGHVQVQNGQLTGVEVNKAVAGLLSLPDLKEVNFKDWTNAFTVTDGRIFVKDLNISAFDADYTVNGSQGLLDGTLDFTMSLILPEKTSAKATIPGVGGQAMGLLKDESGRVKLDFTVRGTSDDPKVALDTEALQRKAGDLAKQKAAQEGKKLEEDLKKKAGDTLKGIFKKKK